jgi:hypothetical protein
MLENRFSFERFGPPGVALHVHPSVSSRHIEGFMRDRLPNRFELGIFAVMALLCAVVVALVPKHDYAMMFASMPLFAVSAVMGLRRNERYKPSKLSAVEPKDELIS